MRVEKTENVNFTMAWHKGAKKALSLDTAKLWTGQDEVVKTINDLEHNSPHHILDYRNYTLFALRDSIYGENFISMMGLKWGLKSMKKFLTKQNEDIPKIEQLSNKFEPALKKYANDKILDSGLRITPEHFPLFTVDLSRNIVKNPKSGNFEDTVKLFDDIDKKAKATDAVVTISPYAYHIRRIFFKNELTKTPVDEVKTLKKINKKLDKLGNEIHDLMSREDRYLKEDLKAAQRFDQNKKLLSVIKNSKIYGFLQNIKATIKKPFKDFTQSKAEKLNSAQKEISKKLDI